MKSKRMSKVDATSFTVMHLRQVEFDALAAAKVLHTARSTAVDRGGDGQFSTYVYFAQKVARVLARERRGVSLVLRLDLD